MDINLKKAGHDYYREVPLSPMACETTRESIVPDSCPDIARIVETTGLVCITGRELTADGRFTFSGTVEVSVLYIPEKGEAIRSLRFPVPFQCSGDGRDEGEWEFPHATAVIRSIDTRLLNPRKVLTRVDLMVDAVCWCRRNLSLCCDGEEEDLQLLTMEEESREAVGVREKEFSVCEELPIPPGRGRVEEVLSTRLTLRETDVKIIGSKLVAKGLAEAAVLCREEGGNVSLLRQEVPFSQILDGGGAEESWEPELRFMPVSVQCRPGSDTSPDDRHVLTLEVTLCARVALWRREHTRFIADLYSTTSPVTCQMGEVRFLQEDQRQTRRQSLREVLETGSGVRAVLDARAACGPVAVRPDQTEMPLWLQCLYLDEHDALRSVRREVMVTLPGEWDAGQQIRVRAVCAGDVSAGVLPDGVELRLTVEYHIASCRETRFPLVLSAHRCPEQEQEVLPSLVLRKAGRQEDLWSLAKQYRTTGKAILEANGLEEGASLPVDRMLLIPRWRG